MKLTSLAIPVLLFQLMYCRAFFASASDTATVKKYNDEGWKIRGKDLELSKAYAYKAIKIANAIHYERGLSNSLNILGNYYKAKEQYDSAEINYEKSLAIRKKLQDTIKMAISYRNLMSIDKVRGHYKHGIATGLMVLQLLAPKLSNAEAVKEYASMQVNLAPLYEKTGDYNKAIYFASEGKRLYAQQEDEDGVANAAINLGNIYETQKQYDKALQEYNFAIESFSEAGNEKELAKAYNNAGQLYYTLGNYALAIEQYKKSLAIRLEREFSDDVRGSLLNIGLLYEALGRTDSASRYYHQSLKLSLEAGNLESEYEAYRALGGVLVKQKEYKKAVSYLLKALHLSDSSSALPEKMVLLKEISDAYRSSGKSDSALIYTDRYERLNDSLGQSMTKSILLESDLKEKESELALSQETNNKQIVIIIGISLALILLLIIFLMYYSATKAKRRALQLQQLVKEKELLATDAMFMGQEEERKRLSAELHDTIGSILAATKYAFNAIISFEKILEENKFQFQKVDGMLDEAMASVRRISHNMAEGILTEKGLTRTIADLCKSLDESGKIKFNLKMYGFDHPVDLLIQKELYRIIQELITNIIRHSHAQHVNINLLKSAGNINLVIEDDGKGFDPESPNHKKGIGLSNINTRVKKLSGTWNIDSGKGRGTTVVIDIPLTENAL